jgi:nucleolar GTP-binding protein
MFEIPTVLTADEILDKAFKRASKVDYEGPTRLETVREINISKLKSSSDTIVSTMGKYVKAFPSIDRQSPFYAELINVTIGRDKLKKALGAIDWSRGNVARIARDATRQMAAARKIDRIDELRRAAYGRISSFVKQVGKELKFLSKARDIMKKYPAINPEQPTVVIAGAPNVGKSQIVAKISTAKPRVAVYPFTTQEISVGTFERRYLRYQVVDTPGLLDRPLEERNSMELRGILALKHLADIVIFVFDPTETCGYPMSEQEHLLKQIREQFSTVPIIEVENKADLTKSKDERLKISASTGYNITKLVDRIVAALKTEQPL